MKAFSIIAALATAVQAVALITLHLLPTGYNPVRDAVSDYGVGPLPRLVLAAGRGRRRGLPGPGDRPGPAAPVYPDPGGRWR